MRPGMIKLGRRRDPAQAVEDGEEEEDHVELAKFVSSVW